MPGAPGGTPGAPGGSPGAPGGNSGAPGGNPGAPGGSPGAPGDRLGVSDGTPAPGGGPGTPSAVWNAPGSAVQSTLFWFVPVTGCSGMDARLFASANSTSGSALRFASAVSSVPAITPTTWMLTPASVERITPPWRATTGAGSTPSRTLTSASSTGQVGGGSIG